MISPKIVVNTVSKANMMIATIVEMTMTTIVEFVTSLRVGQVTLRISRYTFLIYSIILFIMLFYLAGLEGFEPPTTRFGAGCSAVRATGLFSFLMDCMLATERTILPDLEALLFLLVLGRRVVPILTILAG